MIRVSFLVLAAFLLFGCEGETGARGPGGPAGGDSLPCEVAVGADGSTSITCPDGSTATIPAASCTLEQEGGQTILRCPDGTEALVGTGDGLGTGAVEVEAALYGIGPIAGIAARLEPGGLKASSDADGRIRFDGVEAGIYSIALSFPGYVPFSREGIVVLPGVVRLGEIELRVSRPLHDGWIDGALSSDGRAAVFGYQSAREAYLGMAVDLVTGARHDLGRTSQVGFVDADTAYFVTQDEPPSLRVFDFDGAVFRTLATGVDVSPLGSCGEHLLYEDVDEAGARRVWAVKHAGGVAVELATGSHWMQDCQPDRALAVLTSNDRPDTTVALLGSGQTIHVDSDWVEVSGDWIAYTKGDVLQLRNFAGDVNHVPGPDGLVDFYFEEHLVFTLRDQGVFLWDGTDGARQLDATGDNLWLPFSGWANWWTGTDYVFYDLNDDRLFRVADWDLVELSEDGRWLALGIPTGLALVDLEQTNPEVRLIAPGVERAAWADGALLFLDQGDLKRWTPGGDAAELLVEGDAAEILVGGSNVVLVQGQSLFAVDLADPVPVLLTHARYLTAFSDDGGYFAFVDDWTGSGHVYDFGTGLIHHLDGMPTQLAVAGTTVVSSDPATVQFSSGSRQLSGVDSHWARFP